MLYQLDILCNKIDKKCLHFKWRPLSLSELTPMIFYKGLTYFGSEASKYTYIKGSVYSQIIISKIRFILCF